MNINHKLRQKVGGFTIIEVMIVLVIAALILLIVFLAVPALQRNKRNTQRSNDVAALLAGVNESVANSNGSFPTTCSFATGVVTFTNGSNLNDAKVGYYTSCAVSATATGGAAGNVVYVYPPPGAATAALSATASNDWVYVITGHNCTTAGGSVSGGAKSVAAVYQVESGSGKYIPKCQEG